MGKGPGPAPGCHCSLRPVTEPKILAEDVAGVEVQPALGPSGRCCSWLRLKDKSFQCSATLFLESSLTAQFSTLHKVGRVSTVL